MKAVLAANRKLAVWVIFSGVVLLASVALVGVAIDRSVSERQHSDREICVAFNRFNAVLTTTLRRSTVNLPKLSYFHDHPAELAQQEATIRAQLEQFRQRPC